MKEDKNKTDIDLPKCKEEDCNELSIPDNDGYCLQHICPPSIPLIIQYLNEQKNKEGNDEIK